MIISWYKQIKKEAKTKKRRETRWRGFWVYPVYGNIYYAFQETLKVTCSVGKCGFSDSLSIS